MTRRTVLIGLDGATWTVLDALMQDGTMPFLREYVASSARAPLRTVIPALTPPAWTSLVTGRSPGEHGIFNFFGMEAPDSHNIRLLTSQDVGAETVWSLANRQGKRATVLNFPLTFPAPTIDGYVVAGGWMPWRQLRLGCYPADLYDRLKTLPGFNPRELAMDMAHEEKALEGCRQEEYEGWITLHIRRERHWFNVIRLLMREDPTELTAVLFDGVDKLQHLCWRFLDPANVAALTSPWEQRVREQALEYFRELDTLIAGIVEDAGPEALIVMASDHGFGPQVRTFFVNTWLEQHGYLAWSDGVGPRASETEVLGMGQVARHVYLLDWQRTQAYASMPGGNGIHIVRRSEAQPGGVADEDYEELRTRIIQELGTLVDPSNGEPVVAAVWRREEVFAGPYLDVAPDLTLELTDGGLFSILSSEEAVVPRPQPTGTHRPVGVFIAGGAGVQPGTVSHELSILDVAPLLLYGLGLPTPMNMEGRLPDEVLTGAALKRQPEQRSWYMDDPQTAPQGNEQPRTMLDEEEEMEILRRLQALGYVE